MCLALYNHAALPLSVISVKSDIDLITMMKTIDHITMIVEHFDKTMLWIREDICYCRITTNFVKLYLS